MASSRPESVRETPRKDLSEPLEVTAPSAESASSSLSAVLATVVHQMSQSLTALRGTLELALLKARTTTDFRQAAQKALGSADRLAAVIQSAGELAEACPCADEASVLDFGTLSREVIEDIRPVAEARGVTVRLVDAVRIEVQANRERLYNAMLKMLNFATSRSPDRGKVLVSLKSASGQAFLSIRDEGPPIPAAELGSLFEIAKINPKLLGGAPEMLWDLPAARKLVESSGGSVAVESIAPRGCRILVRLPLASQDR